MRARKVWIYFQRLLQLFDCLIILPDLPVSYSYDAVNNQREWVQFLGPSDFRERLTVTPHFSQIFGVPLVRRRIVRIKGDCPLIVRLSLRKLPLVLVFDGGQSIVSLSECFIDFDRLQCSSLR